MKHRPNRIAEYGILYWTADRLWNDSMPKQFKTARLAYEEAIKYVVKYEEEILRKVFSYQVPKQ
jgi:hypothetical protein